jgi:hypothetical protein
MAAVSSVLSENPVTTETPAAFICPITSANTAS